MQLAYYSETFLRIFRSTLYANNLDLLMYSKLV